MEKIRTLIKKENQLYVLFILLIFLFYLIGLQTDSFKGEEEFYWLTLGSMSEKLMPPFSSPLFLSDWIKSAHPYPLEERPVFFRLLSVIPSFLTLGSVYLWGSFFREPVQRISSFLLLATSLVYFYGNRLLGLQGWEGFFLFLGLSGPLTGWLHLCQKERLKKIPLGAKLGLIFYPFSFILLHSFHSSQGVWILLTTPLAWALWGLARSFHLSPRESIKKAFTKPDPFFKFSFLSLSLFFMGEILLRTCTNSSVSDYLLSQRKIFPDSLSLKSFSSSFLFLLFSFMPWSMFLPLSFKRTLPLGIEKFPFKEVLGIWAAVAWFSSLTSPRGIYEPFFTPFLFSLPPLALCVGDFIGTLWKEGGKPTGKIKSCYGFYLGLVTFFSLVAFAEILYHSRILELWYPMLFLITFINFSSLIVVYRGFFHKIRSSLILLATTQLVFLHLIDIVTPALSGKMGAPFSEAILQNLKPEDSVITYKNILPDLPLRLERIIGAYAASFQFPGYKTLSFEEVTSAWKGRGVCYMMVREEDLEEAISSFKITDTFYLKKEGHLILVSNKNPSWQEEKPFSNPISIGVHSSLLKKKNS